MSPTYGQKQIIITTPAQNQHHCAQLTTHDKSASGKIPNSKQPHAFLTVIAIICSPNPNDQTQASRGRHEITALACRCGVKPVYARLSAPGGGGEVLTFLPPHRLRSGGPSPYTIPGTYTISHVVHHPHRSWMVFKPFLITKALSESADKRGPARRGKGG